jgi:hypothetical protein
MHASQCAYQKKKHIGSTWSRVTFHALLLTDAQSLER